MNDTFIQWLIGQAGIAGLAGLALWLLDKSHKDRAKQDEEHAKREIANADSHREDKKTMIAVVSENAKALQSLTGVIERSLNERNSGNIANQRGQGQS